MMQASEFIKEQLLKANIASIQGALYEYHEYSDTHFVKIVPYKIVDGSEYDRELSQIIVDFEERFPGEMLCFLGESSLTKLENPIELLPTQEITYISPQLYPNLTNLFTTDFFSQYSRYTFFSDEYILNPLLSGNPVSVNINTNFRGLIPGRLFQNTAKQYLTSPVSSFFVSDIRLHGIVSEPEEEYIKEEDILSQAA